jgi:hypothetical protein
MDNLKEFSALVWSDTHDEFVREFNQFPNIEIKYLVQLKWTLSNYSNNLERLEILCRTSKLSSEESLKSKNIFYAVFTVLNQENINLSVIPNILKNIFKHKKTNFLLSKSEKHHTAIYNLIFNDFKPQNLKLFNESTTIYIVDNDLVGVNGWKSLSSMFDFLNLTTRWLIIRNHEDLSDSKVFKDDDDIDLLCENLDIFKSLVNAKKRSGGRCSHTVNNKGKNILLDIRYVGDKYFDPIWQKDMLNRRIFKNGKPVLNDFDYFFSLIYHIKLQKNVIKPIYNKKLNQLKKNLKIFNIKDDFIYDNLISTTVLNNFLETYNYNYCFTNDAYRNLIFLKNIKHIEVLDTPRKNTKALLDAIFLNIKIGIKTVIKK